MTLLTEFNEESFIKHCRREQAVESAIKLLKMKLLTPEQIAEAQGLPIEKVLELQKEIAVKA